MNPPPIAVEPATRGTIGLLVRALGGVLDRLDAGLASGAIEVTLPTGGVRMLGGRGAGPAARIMLHRWRALVRAGLGGSSGLYRAWAAGDWESPDPVALFEVIGRNRRTLGETGRAQGIMRIVKRLHHAMRRNTLVGARRNIEAHYDLGDDFYATWLDPSMTYSSALFDDALSISLEAAQARKLEAMLARTGTAPGDHILEIGCGWGSFAALAAHGGRRVTAVTISPAQAAYVEKLGLPGVTVSCTDYRKGQGVYDAVVSIEMAEAVGQAWWPAYLAAIARALKPGGRAALQFIAIDDAIFESYARNVDFIQRYVFPGGMLLSESRFRTLADGAGLEWRDRASFGAHYAETLKAWRARFEAAVAEGRLSARNPAFLKLWRYYLMYCEGGFRGGGIDVVQVTLVKR